MENPIVKYAYEGQEVEFDVSNFKLMVNATEMAKPFNAQIAVFMRNDATKLFIDECLKSENSHFLGIQTQNDLYVSKQRSGTWMHRVLALKFAAWLNPRFELWVYLTIDQILREQGPVKPESVIERQKLLKEKSGWEAKILRARERISKNNGDDNKIIRDAELELRDITKKLNKRKREDEDQLNVFANQQMAKEDETAQEDESSEGTEE